MPERGIPSKQNKRPYRSTLMPEQRQMQARMAAWKKWEKTEDWTAATAAARLAARGRYETLVDPESRLPADERAKRARAAEMAHMIRMSLASSRKRKRSSKENEPR